MRKMANIQVVAALNQFTKANSQTLIYVTFCRTIILDSDQGALSASKCLQHLKMFNSSSLRWNATFVTPNFNIGLHRVLDLLTRECLGEQLQILPRLQEDRTSQALHGCDRPQRVCKEKIASCVSILICQVWQVQLHGRHQLCHGGEDQFVES